MFRIALASIVALSIATTSAFAQESKVADDAIREAIAFLKARMDKAEKAADAKRLHTAIRSLELVVSKSKVTRENYAKLRDGDETSIQQIEAILGPGKQVSSTQRLSTYEWRSEPTAGQSPIVITVTLRVTFTGTYLDSKSIFD